MKVTHFRVLFPLKYSMRKSIQIELPLKNKKVKGRTKCVGESFSFTILFLLGKKAKDCI